MGRALRRRRRSGSGTSSGYFFLGGLAGGAYLLGTLLRPGRDRDDDGRVARLAFLVAFPRWRSARCC